MTAILAHRVTLGRRATNFVSRLPNSGVLLFLGGMALGLTLGSAQVNRAFGAERPTIWWADWLQNFSTEMFGAFLTFILLELIVQTRERRGHLIREMRSPDNGTARNAVEELRAEGWLFDGTLRGKFLFRADLHEADLWEADLQAAHMSGANLRGANLTGAVLRAARLSGADLQGAKLLDADLSEAALNHANLQAANLGRAKLEGCNLSGANLRGVVALSVAQLRQAGTLQGAALPDGAQLPDGDAWRAAFEAWAATAPTDEKGYVRPAAAEG